MCVCKLLVLKEMVGAKGFEPSTSWSRTKYLNPINALSGVAYGTKNVISPLLVVRKLSVAVNTIRTCRSRACSREISKFQSDQINQLLPLFLFALSNDLAPFA
jgi:hypothetical protein